MRKPLPAVSDRVTPGTLWFSVFCTCLEPSRSTAAEETVLTAEGTLSAGISLPLTGDMRTVGAGAGAASVAGWGAAAAWTGCSSSGAACWAGLGCGAGWGCFCAAGFFLAGLATSSTGGGSAFFWMTSTSGRAVSEGCAAWGAAPAGGSAAVAGGAVSAGAVAGGSAVDGAGCAAAGGVSLAGGVAEPAAGGCSPDAAGASWAMAAVETAIAATAAIQRAFVVLAMFPQPRPGQSPCVLAQFGGREFPDHERVELLARQEELPRVAVSVDR